MINDKQALLNHISNLYREHDRKTKEANLPEGCGIVTKESMQIVRLLPQMHRLNITIEDIERGYRANRGNIWVERWILSQIRHPRQNRHQYTAQT